MTRASTGSSNWVFTIYLFTGHIHVGIFMSHTLLSIFYSYISHSLYDLNTPFLHSHVIPVLLESQPLPQLQFFRISCPMSFWSRPPTFLEPHITLNPPPPLPHPTSCMHLVAHNHACPFYFLNRISFVPKFRETHVFSHDYYTPYFLPELYK